MTLSQFIDYLYGYQELLVLVYDEESYDSMWELVDAKIPLEEYGKEYANADFAIDMKYTDIRLSYVLSETYSNAEVTHFIVTNECMIVFINKHEKPRQKSQQSVRGQTLIDEMQPTGDYLERMDALMEEGE